MKIEKCLYVCGTEVFKGHTEVWDAFVESSSDCSWGNNHRTLVSRDFLLTALELIDAEGVETVLGRLESLPAEVYVDLEN
jgi:hypothetical protein